MPYRTVPMMLVAHSCLAELAFGCEMFGMALFTFQHDLQQVPHYDTLCNFRGYMAYVVTFLQNYSYLLQAIYRYIVVVYPTRLAWQSKRVQLLLICLMWIVGFLCPLPFLITGAISYNADNQICQMPYEYSLQMVYNGIAVYLLPVGLIVVIYLRLIRYVRKVSKQTALANALTRAQRELKMVQRLVILVSGVITIGFPYTLLVFISFFTTPPRYHYRVSYVFVNFSLVFVMMAILQFTQPLKASMSKRFKCTTVNTPAMIN